MRRPRGRVGLAPVTAALVLLAAPALALDLVADPDPVIAVRIKNATIPARVSLTFDRALLLDLPAAEAAGLRPFPLLGKRTVDNSLLPGGRATFRGNFYRVTPAGLPGVNAPTGWVDKAIDPRHRAIVSIFALDTERVAIVRPTAPAGGAVIAIPRNGEGDAQTDLELGGETIRVSFDLATPRTIMSARAAGALLGAGLATRTGAVGLWAPIPGVALPYERLRATAGATLLGLPLATPVARITEARAKELDALAKAGTSTVADDADAIIVTARSERRGRRAWLIVGADMLDRCSRIELDRAGKRWLMTCRFT